MCSVFVLHTSPSVDIKQELYVSAAHFEDGLRLVFVLKKEIVGFRTQKLFIFKIQTSLTELIIRVGSGDPEASFSYAARSSSGPSSSLLTSFHYFTAAWR